MRQDFVELYLGVRSRLSHQAGYQVQLELFGSDLDGKYEPADWNRKIMA